MSLIAEDDFFRKISIPLLFHNSFNKLSLMCVVSRLQFLSQLNFVSMKMKIFRENTLQRASRNIQFLTKMPNWCLWTLSFDALCLTTCWRPKCLRLLIDSVSLNFQLSRFFFSLATLYFTNDAKFRSCVNFGTPFYAKLCLILILWCGSIKFANIS